MTNGELMWLAGFIILPLVVGAIGGVVTAEAIPEWYSKLKKPSFNPPNWIFGPVWTTLYVMMGVASWLVWREKGFESPWMWVYGIQLVLNAFWSWIFFGLKKVDFALFDIVAMWVAIAVCAAVFFPISLWAGLLLIPYLAWVSFASILNFRIWALNR